VGLAKVTIESASGLHVTGAEWEIWSSRKANAFCVCRIQGRKRILAQTRVKIDEHNPVWNHEFRIDTIAAAESLEFVVMDKDLGHPDKVLGRALLPWAQVPQEDVHGFSGRLPLLEYKRGGAHLSVKVELVKRPSDSDEATSLTISVDAARKFLEKQARQHEDDLRSYVEALGDLESQIAGRESLGEAAGEACSGERAALAKERDALQAEVATLREHSAERAAAEEELRQTSMMRSEAASLQTQLEEVGKQLCERRAELEALSVRPEAGQKDAAEAEASQREGLLISGDVEELRAEIVAAQGEARRAVFAERHDREMRHAQEACIREELQTLEAAAEDEARAWQCERLATAREVEELTAAVAEAQGEARRAELAERRAQALQFEHIASTGGTGEVKAESTEAEDEALRFANAERKAEVWQRKHAVGTAEIKELRAALVVEEGKAERAEHAELQARASLAECTAAVAEPQGTAAKLRGDGSVLREACVDDATSAISGTGIAVDTSMGEDLESEAPDGRDVGDTCRREAPGRCAPSSATRRAGGAAAGGRSVGAWARACLCVCPGTARLER